MIKAHEPVARVRRPAASVLDGIGDTPLVRLENIVTLFCDEGEKYISEHIFRTEGGGRGDEVAETESAKRASGLLSETPRRTRKGDIRNGGKR